VDYYEVFGIPRDASSEEVRHAYLAKTSQLHRDELAGAPDDVVNAVNKASATFDEAWATLGDAVVRAHYDAEFQLLEGIGSDAPSPSRSSWRRRHAEHVWAMERELGNPLTPVLGLHPPAPGDPIAKAPGDVPGLADGGMSPSQEWLASPLFDPLADLETIADWFAPHPRPSKTVTVPDVCRMHASDAFYEVAKADLQINFVRLTDDPTGGDGIVVDQDPAPGTSVRRHSKLTVQVVYPEAHPVTRT